MRTITVATEQPYNIYIGEKLLTSDSLINFCRNLANRFIVISDDIVFPLFGKKLQNSFQQHNIKLDSIIIPHGENNKSRLSKAFIEDRLFEMNCGRDTCLLALGGGVVTDLTGFVAATYCRGIPVVYLPTTLLAMVDASIGGKTGINTAFGKNLLGTFTQPCAVYSDVNTLSSLSYFEYITGFTEVIKHALIYDCSFFEELNANRELIKGRDPESLITMIEKSCHIKRKIVEIDVKETGMRALLNFGHTIGHAIEAVLDYQINHGVAVAIGIIVESYLSMLCGYLSKNDFTIIHTCINSFSIPIELESQILTRDKLKAAMLHDKKTRQGLTRFVLLDKIGVPHIKDGEYTHVTEMDQLEASLDFLIDEFVVHSEELLV